jgi:hypothetical protein
LKKFLVNYSFLSETEFLRLQSSTVNLKIKLEAAAGNDRSPQITAAGDRSQRNHCLQWTLEQLKSLQETEFALALCTRIP